MKRSAVIYPRSRKIACVLLQAVYGGDSQIPSLYFDTAQWALFPPEEKGIMVAGTPDEWDNLSRRWREAP